ncbi:MAG TPA: hypothetical protein VFD82_24660 [Planctomycetota bacterium]|nr:hypothetical protein [Planctomycetota bacterium]
MTTDTVLVHLQHRIHVLERRARTTRRAALVAFMALAGLACLEAPQGAEIVRARRLEIVDDKGVVRVVIGQDPKDTQRRARACGLTVHDTTGAERGGFSTFDDMSVVLGLDAPTGVGHPMRDRIGLQVAPDGSASVGLIDNETQIPVRLKSDAGGGGGLEFIGYDAEHKKATIRRLAFAGETKQDVPLGDKK